MQSTYTVKFLISHLADPRGFQEELTRVTDTIKPSSRAILTDNKPEVESALFLRAPWMAAKIRAKWLTPNLWRHSQQPSKSISAVDFEIKDAST